MNPWKPQILDLLRSVLRFALWLAIVVNGLMFAVFTVVFTYYFLRNAWGWCARVLFSAPW